MESKILIVDDKAENRLVLTSLLDYMKLSHVEACDGEEALKMLLKNNISLILLDINMPRMNGLETAGYIKGNSKTKQIPIIFLSASGREEAYVSKEFADLNIDYIQKPFSVEAISEKISLLLKG